MSLILLCHSWTKVLILFHLWHPAKRMTINRPSVEEVFSWVIFFFKSRHKSSIGFRSGLFAWHVIDFFMPFLNKSFYSFCSVTRWIIILKNDLSWVSMYISALIVEVMISIPFGPLNANPISGKSREIFLFSFGSHFYMLNLNSTRQKCQYDHRELYRFMNHVWISLSSNWPHGMIVSLEPFLSSFSLSITVGFYLAFLSLNPISLSRFLTVLSQTLPPVSTHLFFTCFVVHFLFSRHIALGPLSWRFGVFCGLPLWFSFNWIKDVRICKTHTHTHTRIAFATSYIEHETTAVRPLASDLKNHSS